MPYSGNRRNFLRQLTLGILGMHFLSSDFLYAEEKRTKPNIILMMADDLGWGDTGYNGHPDLKTPYLDEMSRKGIRFDRFYAGAPVCSPTRGSCLTGRHPYRYGIFHASIGHLPVEEVTLAEVLKGKGYATAHFGKWHMGYISPEKQDHKNYSPPHLNGFDHWFSTRGSVPTWEPWQQVKSKGMSEEELSQRPDEPWQPGYFYNGEQVSEKLRGDDSKVIIDWVIPFIRNQYKRNKPFITVIWFHTPHSPVIAEPRHRQMYANLPVHEQHHHGCITAMDEQIGRLRKELQNLGVWENTMLWFCSDNGPEYFRSQRSETDLINRRYCGSSGPFRGAKRSLFEGGIRVPALLEWPKKIKEPRIVNMACSTMDYFPTILDILGETGQLGRKPLDGISILPAIEGRMSERSSPICFESEDALAVIDNRFKLVRPGHADLEQQAYLPSMGTGRIGSIFYAKWWREMRGNWPVEGNGDFLLFDLLEDPGETRNLTDEKPKRVDAMKKVLSDWQISCRNSYKRID